MSLPVLVATMVVAAAVGQAAERRWHDRAVAASRGAMRLMLVAVLPPVYFVLVSRLHLDGTLIGGIATAYVVLGIVGALAWLAASRWLRLAPATVGGVVLAVILANTGYFGLPFTQAVLGHEELGGAIAWDSFVSNPMFFGVAFVVGAAFSPRVGAGGEESHVGALLRNPLLWASVLGLAVPWDAPAWSADVARAVVTALLPIGFFVVGVQLTAESEQGVSILQPLPSREVAVAIVLRLLVAPALVLGASALLLDLPDGMLLQAAAPTGLNGLLVAHRFDLDLRPVAGSIVWTTAIVALAALVVAIA